MIASIDFEKAFDHIDYNSVHKILAWFNFGPNLIGMVKTLFCNFKLVTINNGYTSQYFKPTRGLFQGNPISSYLFILVVELLAVLLHSNVKIKGIRVGDQTMLLTQFADDLGLILEYNERSWNAAVKMFNVFQSATGLLINYEKSVIYRIGALRNSNAKFYSARKLQWMNDPIKVLGVYLVSNQTELIDLNLQKVITKAEAIIKMWKLRGLSLFGKIAVLNTLVAFLFVYRLSVMPLLPDRYMQQIRKIYSDFLWEGKKAKVSMHILQVLKSDGGSGLAGIQNRANAQKLEWIYRIKENEKMQALADALLHNKIGATIWEMQLNKQHAKKLFPKNSFWHNVAKLWADLMWKEVKTIQDIKEQPL